jgi:hypothetical protein
MLMLNNYLNMLFESISYSDDIKFVYEIMSTFSDEEKKFAGTKDIHEECNFREVKIYNNIPVAYFEAKIFGNKAKINIGVNSKYRNKNHMKDLFDKSVLELSKLGVNKVLAAVSKQNNKSSNFLIKKGFIKLTKKKLDEYKWKGHWNINYYELSI